MVWQGVVECTSWLVTPQPCQAAGRVGEWVQRRRDPHGVCLSSGWAARGRGDARIMRPTGSQPAASCGCWWVWRYLHRCKVGRRWGWGQGEHALCALGGGAWGAGGAKGVGGRGQEHASAQCKWVNALDCLGMPFHTETAKACKHRPRKAQSLWWSGSALQKLPVAETALKEVTGRS